MNEPQTTTASTYYPQASRGVFGTKIPASVTFAVGVLLFLLPFAELKCTAKDNQDSFMRLSQFSMSFTNTGIGLAFGSDWKTNMPSLGGMAGNERSEDNWKKDMKPQEPNNYAIVALALAIAGLVLSFTSSKAWIAISIASGVLSAAALIGLMIDLRDQSKDLVKETEKAGNQFSMTEGSGFVLNFTPWFYVTVIAMIVAAYFSYLRMRHVKK